jgi:hypothetical protein
MREHGIPTAAYRSFDDADEADRYVDGQPARRPSRPTGWRPARA